MGSCSGSGRSAGRTGHVGCVGRVRRDGATENPGDPWLSLVWRAECCDRGDSDHSDGRLGAVMCIEDTPNPVRVAAALLDESIHVLAGDGARDWADDRGFVKATVEGSERPSSTDTVGAVAIDSDGAMAVACSTGGCSGRPRGRVGDTPLWGSGFWIDERIALTATGIGEAITQKLLCHRVALHEGSIEDALRFGLDLFDPSIEVGLIGRRRRNRAGQYLHAVGTQECNSLSICSSAV
ncbi:MAG TPA: hypothetical protein EYQ80_03520 [Candidatus Poseidoniales archaeon]|nr:hypothetical protein [Candidatus Poseidoniales archaeon]